MFDFSPLPFTTHPYFWLVVALILGISVITAIILGHGLKRIQSKNNWSDEESFLDLLIEDVQQSLKEEYTSEEIKALNNIQERLENK